VVSHAPNGYSEPDSKVEDHDYYSDELDSSDPDESDDDRVGPKAEKFRRSQLNATFKFNKGMEFNTLNERPFVISLY
ncbi:hypothetical protein A2U01_0072353, partial [Trifolium medium]|nr:hypothetical protein [Trifolium medium]